MRAAPFAVFASLFVVVSLWCAPAAQAGDAAAPKIAVLRLEDLMGSAKVFTIGMDKVKKSGAEANAQVKAMDEDLQKLEGQMQVLKQGSPKFSEANEAFETLKLKRKLFIDRVTADIDHTRVVLIRQVFAGMREKLAAFCKERGIMIVHLAPNPDLGAPSATEIQVQLGFQTVLYFDPSTDITDAFLAYLDKNLTPESLAAEDAKAVPPAAVAPAPADAGTKK